jgi:hypothetical protein
VDSGELWGDAAADGAAWLHNTGSVLISAASYAAKICAVVAISNAAAVQLYRWRR